MRRWWLTRSVVLVVIAGGWGLVPVGDASARPGKLVCGVAGVINRVAGQVCNVARNSGKIIGAGRKLAGGHVGSAIGTILGGGSSVSSTATTALGLAAIGVWVVGGARFALHQTAKVLGATTAPHLTATWFSSAYWRVAGIAALLTLPLLFAAGVQALMRSDLPLLVRSLGYLPLSLLAVSIAAPVTMLLLAASDEMSVIVSSAGGGASSVNKVLFDASAASVLNGSPFILFLVAGFSAAGAILLWVELALREAAVYVVVLMLPLAFAALVWPARRIWAIRAIELLVALILSKFAIVAVLTLGSAALGHSGWTGVSGQLVGLVLLLLGVFTPWALLKLLPLHELASGAVGSLRSASGAGLGALGPAWAAADQGAQPVEARTMDASDDAAREAAAAEADRLRSNQSADPGAKGDPSPDSAAAPGSVPGSGAAHGSAAAPGPGAAAGAAAAPGSAAAPRPGAAPGPVGTAAANGAGAGHPDGAFTGSAGSAGLNGDDGPAEPMPEMWHQPDESWSELVLGPEAGERQQLWPRERSANDDRADGSAEEPSPPESRTADDPDPRPPEQPPEDGRL